MTVSQAPDSDGDIKMIDLSGVLALAASLQECGLTSLECATAPKCSPSCQRPLTQKRTLLRSLPCQKANTFPFRTHIPCSQTHTHTLPSPFLHIHAMPPSIVRRVDRGQPRPPVGRVGRVCSRAHLTPPATSRPPRHSLRDNYLNKKVIRAIKKAAGSGVSIDFGYVKKAWWQLF